MFFRRIRRLDCPQWMRDELLFQINNDILTPTGMVDSKYALSREQIIAIANSVPESEKFSEEKLEYFLKSTGTNDLTGWEPTTELRKKILNHYDSFLRLVPDEPKIIIKRIISQTNKFNLHCGRAQVSSLTCLITGEGPVTAWYEPLPKFEYKFRSPPGTRHMNKKGLSPYPPETQMITSIKMRPWEMILFDHNAIHQVENFQPDMTRILFSIGFLNITETELEDIYDRWWTSQL
jgi:hypothetical protein